MRTTLIQPYAIDYTVCVRCVKALSSLHNAAEIRYESTAWRSIVEKLEMSLEALV